MSTNPYLFELLDGVRMPTTEEVRGALAEIQDEEAMNPASLRSDYFTTTESFSDEIEMFVEDNRQTGGMTYIHTFGSEPRSFTQRGGAAHKVKWSGMYFMEFSTIGHDQLLKLAQLSNRQKRVQITEQVAKSLRAMELRSRRRENWIAAQLLTKGKIVVTPDMHDNPERASYTLDYRVKNPVITLDTEDKWNHKDAAGDYTADVVDFALSLKEQRADADLPLPRKWIMNSKTLLELQRNDVIYKKYWQRLLMGHNGRMEVRDIIADPRLLGGQFLGAFKQLTGIDIEVRDDTVNHRDGTNEKLIPDGHVTILYGEGDIIGEFTYLAHLYGNDGKLGLGTGPFVFTNITDAVTNPSYTIYKGFNAMPILTPEDYDSNFEYNRIQTMQVLV
ncbi:major capsid protein [Deinococcus kurensis]|uniref:major capsid protein n=1 Tax=Deinococcus kurensis TaxID=2662757 RepID=UPI0012D2F454|nr:major capsid protein [Deinococcus kurensis]